MKPILLILGLTASTCLGASDREIIAATILSEARGEGRIGMTAVANVIQNRAKAQKKSAKHVVLAPWQFSCWRVGTPPMKVLAESKGSQKSVALRLAGHLALRKPLKDVTGGARFYCRHDCYPAWRRTFKQTAKIGNHVFFIEGRAK